MRDVSAKELLETSSRSLMIERVSSEGRSCKVPWLFVDGIVDHRCRYELWCITVVGGRA